MVTIRDGRIVGVQGEFPPDAARAQEGVECFDGCMLAPGFVNAHSHIEYAPYLHLSDGLPFGPWVEDHIVRKRRLNPEQMRAGALLGAWQAAAAGITCLGDASFSGDAAHAMREVGLRGRVYLEVFCASPEPVQARNAMDEVLAKLSTLPVNGPLIQGGISPHAPYSVSRSLYELVAAEGVPWMTHLAESQAEIEAVYLGTGPIVDALARQGFPVAPPLGEPPIASLADLLSPNSIVVHAVYASLQDAGALGQSGAWIAHCPRSNALLGCGTMNLGYMDSAGVRIALGTDSPASAGPLDMFDEMRAALYLHRASRGSASAINVRRVLRMATTDAAAALGIEGVGAIAPGNHADMLACRLPEGADDPLIDYVTQCTPRDIVSTMVAGKVVSTADSSALKTAFAAARPARQLLARAVPEQAMA
jgi:5-methylthioadenosine/S-adenosylhomocysteine deaminase